MKIVSCLIEFIGFQAMLLLLLLLFEKGINKNQYECKLKTCFSLKPMKNTGFSLFFFRWHLFATRKSCLLKNKKKIWTHTYTQWDLLIENIFRHDDFSIELNSKSIVRYLELRPLIVINRCILKDSTCWLIHYTIII